MYWGWGGGGVELRPQGIIVNWRFLSPNTHSLSVSFISDLPAVSHCSPPGPWRQGFAGRGAEDIMARNPCPRHSVTLGVGCLPGHQLCRAWGKGRDVTGRGGYLCQSFCQPYLPKGHCAELGSRLGEGREWSLNYASSRGSHSSDTPGSPNSVSATRFSAGGSLQGAVGVECGQGVPHTPFIPPPRFSCLRCWRPVAKQPIKSFLTPSCSNSRISMPSCLSGCLGGSVERPGHLSKSWALTLSTHHCLGPYFALRKGRKIPLLS